MFFSTTVGRRREGWSEGVICVGATALPAALTSLVNLAIARVNLLGMGVTCDYLRVSDTTVWRDSQVVDGPTPNPLPPALVTQFAVYEPEPIYNSQLATGLSAVGPQAGQGLSSDFPSAGFLLRLEGGTSYTQRRSYIIRGNPDYAQAVDFLSPKGAAYQNSFNTFVNLLISGPYGFLPLASVAGLQVTAVSAAPPWTITVPGIAATLGSQIRIRGAKVVSGTTPLNGLWTVQNNAGGVLTLFGYTGPTVLMSAPNAYTRNKTPIAFNKVVSRRWATKKTGVPFDPARGRAKKKKSAT
jgi:hypothetical protein